MVIKKVINEVDFLGCWKRRRFALLLLFFVYYDVGDVNVLCRMSTTGSFQNQNFLMFKALHKVSSCFLLYVIICVYSCLFK